MQDLLHTKDFLCYTEKLNIVYYYDYYYYLQK